MLFIKQKLLLITLRLFLTNGQICKDDQNQAVDWFVVSKLPKMREGDSNLKSGLSYIYKTSNNYDQWIHSNKSIGDEQSIIGNTLEPLYKKRNKLGFLLYNDQPPQNKTANSNKGHNKGVILVKNEQGLWLIHSVPQFPILDFYEYPRNGAIYGQSFLCITLNLTNLDNVGLQLQYNEPVVYEANFPDYLQNSLENLFNASKNVTIKKALWFRQASVVSNAGINFVSFAKTRRFGQDLYEDWIAPSLESNLFVETWPNGRGKLSSNCTQRFKVNNVESLQYQTTNFTTTRDHSKWAVSSNDKNWICIGDINRMERQKMRGGGSVCVQNQKLADGYLDMIENIEACKKNY